MGTNHNCLEGFRKVIFNFFISKDPHHAFNIISTAISNKKIVFIALPCLHDAVLITSLPGPDTHFCLAVYALYPHNQWKFVRNAHLQTLPPDSTDSEFAVKQKSLCDWFLEALYY